MLAALNFHPRDGEIFFNEPSHKYTTKKVSDMISVTTFVKSFFEEFNADLVLQKMQRFGSLDKKYPGMTMQEVKASWKDKGAIAAKTGTKLHRYIELFINGEEEKDIETIDIEVEMFQDWFANLSQRYIPYRTEWVIYDEDLRIAGTIDMLFKIQEKRVAIFDWKCSKEIKFKNTGKAKSPIGHLDDCNYIHYCLQLNLYKFLLEKNYDLIVEEMNLVVIHRNNNSAQVIPVKDMQQEIRKIISIKKENERRKNN